MHELTARELVERIRGAQGRFELVDTRVIGKVDFDKLTFAHPLEFRDCVFEETVTFFRPTFAAGTTSLAFERCPFVTLRIQWPSWQDPGAAGVISLLDCKIRKELGIQLDVGDNGNVTLVACSFEQNWRIINGSSTTRVSLVRCRASKLASGSISCSDLGGLVELERCDLDGRLACGVHAIEKPSNLLRGIFGFYGTAIRGQLEICTGSPDETVSWIDMRDTRIAGGSISLSASPFNSRKSWRPQGWIGAHFAASVDWIWKSSWDQTAFVLDEILANAKSTQAKELAACGKLPQRLESFPATEEAEVLRELRTEVYSQYDELQQSYTQTAGADDLEDFCKYRMSVYRSLSTGMVVNGSTVLICVFFVLLMTFDWLDELPPIFGIKATPLLWGTFLICACLGRHQAVATFRFIFHSVFLRHMLGYGVILRRVLVSGIGLIVAFALVFVVNSSRANRSDGVVYTQNGIEYKISLDPSPDKDSPGESMSAPAGFLTTFERAIYFSTVTFTTLGYGDLVPRGRARLVAGVEALTGVFYISMLVVVLARRYLRM